MQLTTGKEKVKVFLFLDNMILNIIDPQNSTREHPLWTNTFSKLDGYSINSKQSVVFLYTTSKWAKKKKLRKTPFVLATKI